MDTSPVCQFSSPNLFPALKQPVRIYATPEVNRTSGTRHIQLECLPAVSELKNDYGPVMEYVPIPAGKEFKVAHLTVTAVAVNHIVPTIGLVISDGNSTVAFKFRHVWTEEFWTLINRSPHMDALLIEASFPDSMAKLAEVTRHFTPASLGRELGKLNHNGSRHSGSTHQTFLPSDSNR